MQDECAQAREEQRDEVRVCSFATRLLNLHGGMRHGDGQLPQPEHETETFVLGEKVQPGQRHRERFAARLRGLVERVTPLNRRQTHAYVLGRTSPGPHVTSCQPMPNETSQTPGVTWPGIVTRFGRRLQPTRAPETPTRRSFRAATGDVATDDLSGSLTGLGASIRSNTTTLYARCDAAPPASYGSIEGPCDSEHHR